MDSRVRVNIGAQRFDRLREQKAFYIDKTHFIKEQASASLGTALMMLLISVLGAGAAAGAAVDAGATLAALPYQAAFGLSSLFAAVVLVTAVWKIR